MREVLATVCRPPVYAGDWASIRFFCNCGVRKASFLLFSVSMVKRVEGCWLFKCFKKLSTLSRANMIKMSS